MKKHIALILAMITIIASCFVACSEKTIDEKKPGETTTEAGLEGSGDEYIIETEDVTDENGETVTDKNGEAVTELVAYRQDSKNKNTYIKTDSDGKDVTNKKGQTVTKKVKTTTTKKAQGETSKKPVRPDDPNPREDIETIPSNDSLGTTKKELTTLPLKDDVVPKTSATGKAVAFSADDQATITNMLEVPYLYCESYENEDGVPTNVAAHVAMWMANREHLNTTEYASGTIVLDLFKYFAQTVVNFKANCNDGKDSQSSIKYNSAHDSFIINEFESRTHTVTLTKIENLGNNNYYKVTGTVSGANGIKKVVAIIQRNQIESTLGFSVKALKWS